MIVDAFILQKLLECLRCFVVEALETGGEATAFEEVDAAFVPSEDVGARARPERLCVNIITIVIIDDQQVAVATARWHKETAGEVGCNLASHKLTVDIQVVCAYGGRVVREVGC